MYKAYEGVGGFGSVRKILSKLESCGKKNERLPTASQPDAGQGLVCPLLNSRVEVAFIDRH